MSDLLVRMLSRSAGVVEFQSLSFVIAVHLVLVWSLIVFVIIQRPYLGVEEYIYFIDFNAYNIFVASDDTCDHCACP